MEELTPCVYLGERVDLLGRITQVFKTPSGEELRFSKIRGCCFGSYYGADLKGGTMKLNPPLIEDVDLKKVYVPTKDETLEYEAQKELVKFQRYKKRKALELKKPHRDIVRAIELLHPFCRGMDIVTLSRFTEYLKNQLSKKKRKK